jgi:hypothetical protein
MLYCLFFKELSQFQILRLERILISQLHRKLFDLNLVGMSVKLSSLDLAIPNSNSIVPKLVLLKVFAQSFNLGCLKKTHEFDMGTHEVFAIAWKLSYH